MISAIDSSVILDVVTDDPRFAAASERALRRKLVRRSHVMSIAAAWVITVPASAAIAGAIFWTLQFVRGF